MLTKEHREKHYLGEINEYSKESITKAIENLKNLIETLSQTAVAVKSQSKEGRSVAHELETMINNAKNRLVQLKSVLDLNEDLGLPYHLLDSLETGEHVLIQVLLKQFPYDKSGLAEYLRAEPKDRYLALVEILNHNTHSLSKIVEEKTKEKNRQKMLNDRYKSANPF